MTTIKNYPDTQGDLIMNSNTFNEQRYNRKVRRFAKKHNISKEEAINMAIKKWNKNVDDYNSIKGGIRICQVMEIIKEK